jgi:hypothetical protein
MSRSRLPYGQSALAIALDLRKQVYRPPTADSTLGYFETAQTG